MLFGQKEQWLQLLIVVPINNSTCPRASSREGIAGGITANNFERSVSTRQVGNYAEDTASAWCDGRSLKKEIEEGVIDISNS